MTDTTLFDTMKNALDASDEQVVFALFGHANKLRAATIKVAENIAALTAVGTPVSAPMLSELTVLSAEYNVYQRISQRMMECPQGSTRHQQRVIARLTPLEFLNEAATGNEIYDKALADVLKSVQSASFGL